MLQIYICVAKATVCIIYKKDYSVFHPLYVLTIGFFEIGRGTKKCYSIILNLTDLWDKIFKIHSHLFAEQERDLERYNFL